MKRSLLLAAALALVAGRAAADEAPLKLVQTIALPNVKGRIDHFALDAKRKRLFVAALGNGSVEIVDLEKGERVKSIGGLDEPQGVGRLLGERV